MGHSPVSSQSIISKAGGLAVRWNHPHPQPPPSQHPPSWRGILHLCPAQSLQEQPELQLLEICLHHRVPGSENVSGLQRTFPNAASIQHRAPSCRAAGMGHPKRERIDPSRDRHILVPAVWAVQDRDTCGHCPLSGSGVGKGGDA